MRSLTPLSGATSRIWLKNLAICCYRCLFYAEMAANEGHFTIADVLDHLNRKLVRRHPHVFGDEASKAAGNNARKSMPMLKVLRPSVLRNWEEIKAGRKSPGFGQSTQQDQLASRLDTVQRAIARFG